MPTDDTKLEVLHDHYKDTFEILQGHLRVRDRTFGFILIAVTVVLFQVFAPENAGSLIGQFVIGKLGVTGTIDVTFLGNIIWFAVLALVVRYFQSLVHIERQYDYLHNLESRLNKCYGQKVFTREGEAYLAAYPIFSKWTSLLYIVVFPIFLLGVVGTKSVFDWRARGQLTPSLSISLAISGCIVISTLLAMYWIHIKRRIESESN